MDGRGRAGMNRYSAERLLDCCVVKGRKICYWPAMILPANAAALRLPVRCSPAWHCALPCTSCTPCAFTRALFLLLRHLLPRPTSAGMFMPPPFFLVRGCAHYRPATFSSSLRCFLAVNETRATLICRVNAEHRGAQLGGVSRGGACGRMDRHNTCRTRGGRHAL